VPTILREPLIDGRLLTTQKNDVFRLIQQEQLNPSEFEWNELRTDYAIISVLRYKATEFFFAFLVEPPDFIGVRRPGSNLRHERSLPFSRWILLLGYVAEWTIFLKNEIQAPDLWSSLNQELHYFQELQDLQSESLNSNTVFTPQEQQAIANRIQEAKAYIKGQPSITEQQAKYINEKLDFLVDSSKRQSRQDWMFLAIGVVTTILVSLSLSPEQGKTLFHFITSTFSLIAGNVRTFLNK
jgi:hypothetical protein